jgi:hypothetical protein
METSSNGLFGRIYDGYFDGDPQWFSSAIPASGYNTEIRTDFNIPIGVAPNGFSYEWFGYFKPLSAEGYIEDDFTFNVGSDDSMFMWIGDNALTGNFTAENRLLSAFGGASSSPIALRADTYYPVRIQWGHPLEPTASALNIQANPSLRMANDFSGNNLFYNTDATWTLYRGFYIRINQLLDSGDPSTNQIVFSNSSSAPVGQNRTEDTNNDDFYVSGINGANTVAIVNLYGSSEEVPIPLTYIKNFAHTYIDNVLYNGNALRTGLEDINIAFYTNSNLLSSSMPEGTLFDSFEFNEIQAVYQDPDGGAVFYFDGNTGLIDSYNNINIDLVLPGSGYLVDAEIVIAGNVLGGTTPTNDATITVTSVTPDNGIDGWNITGTPNSQAVPSWFITDGNDDIYDSGNYLGTNRSRCTFTASTNSNSQLVVTNVAEGELMPHQSVWIEEAGEDSGLFTTILWQISGTQGKEGLYAAGGYNYPPSNLSSKVRYANAIHYGVNQDRDGSDIFGTGSTYGSMYVNSIFSMVAVNADISAFYYNGESGADGSGEKLLTPFAPHVPTCDPRFDVHSTERECGEKRFRRLFALGYF